MNKTLLSKIIGSRVLILLSILVIILICINIRFSEKNIEIFININFILFLLVLNFIITLYLYIYHSADQILFYYKILLYLIISVIVGLYLSIEILITLSTNTKILFFPDVIHVKRFFEYKQLCEIMTKYCLEKNYKFTEIEINEFCKFFRTVEDLSAFFDKKNIERLESVSWWVTLATILGVITITGLVGFYLNDRLYTFTFGGINGNTLTILKNEILRVGMYCEVINMDLRTLSKANKDLGLRYDKLIELFKIAVHRGPYDINLRRAVEETFGELNKFPGRGYRLGTGRE